MTPLASLDALGRALGGLRWVQGPGGNVSVKSDDGWLWVKASGRRLVDVATPEGFARAPLETARRALDGDPAADSELFAISPRPSLETYFHALGAQVVAHTHALGVLLYACSNAPYAVEALPGILSIPYVRPGRGIALAVRDVLPAGCAEAAVILRSHGLIVFAPTAVRAIELTLRCDEAVRASMGALPPFDPAPYLEGLEARDAVFEGGILRELPTRAIGAGDPPRYLFPDAAVYAGSVLVDSFGDATSVARAALARGQSACVLASPDGRRVAAARSEAQLGFACEIVAAHDWVEDVLLERRMAQYLPLDEPAHILGMPSEQYRMQLSEIEKS